MGLRVVLAAERTQLGDRQPVTRTPRSSVSKPRWKKVAIPTEHGGWSLTLEPVVLGLIAQWSVAGLLLGIAALLAFLARTPLKLVLVDVWRSRWLPRTQLATKVAVVEIGLIVALTFAAFTNTDSARFLLPILAAAPLVILELWFDMRSRSRRLIPELAGAIGIGSVAPAIAIAGGLDPKLAYGLWIVIAVRAVGALLFVRTQLDRANHRPVSLTASDAAQGTAVVLCGIAAATGMAPWAGFGAIAGMAALQLLLVRMRPRPAMIVGAQQSVIGLVIVVVDGLGVKALS